MCVQLQQLQKAMMDLTEELVSAVNNYVSSSGTNDVVAMCVKQLEAGQVKLVDFVTMLQSALTSSVIAERRRGIQLLSETITALPGTFFSDAEILLLMEFFSARLSDHHSVVPLCFAGIDKLLRLGTLGSADIIRVVRVIFSDVTVQTLVQSDRMLVYKMFDWLLTDRLSDLKEITAEFVCGFVQAVDSEKDPRNLLVCLRLVEAVAMQFALDDTLAEQLFEVVACYYPIDFSPPAALATSVRREQLSTALLSAMTASPLFGQFCLPLLVEKLSSSVASAKADSLQLLVRCCDSFHCKDIDKHSVDLWNCIKSDVFAQHPVVQDEALKALSVLVQCLSDDTDSRPSKLVAVIFGDCGKYLYDAGQVACKQAGKLLSATCNGSAQACCSVLESALPVMVSEFHRHSESLPRQNLLHVFQGLLEAASTVPVNGSSHSPIADYKQVLTEIFVLSLLSTDPALQCQAVSGIACLAVMPCLHELQECRLLTQHLRNVVLTDGDCAVAQESIASAVLIAAKQPDAICHTFLPVLRRILQGSNDMEDIELGQHVDTVFVVRLLSSISVHPALTMETTHLLFTHISTLAVSEKSCNMEVFHQCCVSLTSVVTVMGSDCGEFFISWLAVKCVALTLHMCTTVGRSLHYHDLVAELACILRTILQHCTTAETSLKAFVSSLIETFLQGDVDKYREHVGDLVIADLVPLGAGYCGDQMCSLALLTAVVCSVSYEWIALSQVDKLMSGLSDMILHCSAADDDVVYVCASKCLSGLINRRPSDSVLDTTLQSVQSAVQSEIYAIENNKSGSSSSSKLRALTLCIWTTKALVMRNHPQQSVLLKFLIDNLGDLELASRAAEGFRLVLSDNVELTDGIFSSASGAVRTLMYKQRFFTMSLPVLLADYADSEGGKQAYVKALSHLMQHVPQQVLVPEVPRLMPVLLQSLDTEEPSVWLTTLHALTELIVYNSEALRSYVDDLLPRLLRLSVYSPSMKVRIAAVQCVAELSVMPTYLILPHQQKVLRQLGFTIDDHKRLVRQEAAAARSKWFLVGMSDN